MFAEVSLGVFDLGTVDEAEVPDAAVSEAVDDGPSEPFREVVVNECAAVCPDGGKNDHEEDVQAVVSHGFPGSGGHDHFGREGHEGALDGHEEGDHPVVEVF